MERIGHNVANVGGPVAQPCYRPAVVECETPISYYCCCGCWQCVGCDGLECPFFAADAGVAVLFNAKQAVLFHANRRCCLVAKRDVPRKKQKAEGHPTAGGGFVEGGAATPPHHT